MIRVLVADDSALDRALVVAVLRRDPDLEIVGEASDGLEAVALARELEPDVVTMDVQMPRLGGLEATKEIMIESPRPIVIVTSGRGADEVAVSMLALRAGAVYVLRKPPVVQSPAHASEARRLIDGVKAMARVKVVRHVRRPSLGGATRAAGNGPTPRIVAIAASTGGPAALQRVLGDRPCHFPAPILVVQHMAPGFIDGLAAWLTGAAGLRVKVAAAGERLAPRTVYLAPDDQHLGVANSGTIALSAAPAVNGFRPSGTVLFESVARVFAAGTVAVVLTGMGEDGLDGLRAVRRAGGRIFAQDEDSSVVFGMPGVAVAAGLAQAALPPAEIASALVALFPELTS